MGNAGKLKMVGAVVITGSPMAAGDVVVSLTFLARSFPTSANTNALTTKHNIENNKAFFMAF